MSLSIKAINDFLLLTPRTGEEDVNEFGLVYQEDTSKNALRSGVIVEGPDGEEGKTAHYPADKFYTLSKGGAQYHLVKRSDIAALS